MSITPMPTEIAVLALSTILLLVQLMIQGQADNAERGIRWNAGPRDGDPPPPGVFAGRARRALDNLKETYPAFVALALALAVTDRSGGLGAAGALLWIGARIAYVPLYLAGVPWLRSAVWGLSMVGLAMMFVRLV